MSDIRKEDIQTPSKPITENNYYFLLFENKEIKDKMIIKSDNTTYIWNDLILSSFYLISGWQEKFMRRDNKDRHLIKDSFHANIFWLSKKDLHKDEKITIKCATQETKCRIQEIKRRLNSSTLEIIEEGADRLKDLEVREVLIKTKKSIAIKAFDDVPELGRFVLLRDENTCAGGIVTVGPTYPPSPSYLFGFG